MITRNKSVHIILIAKVSKVLPMYQTHTMFLIQVLKVTKIHSISSFSLYVCTVKGTLMQFYDSALLFYDKVIKGLMKTCTFYTL